MKIYFDPCNPDDTALLSEMRAAPRMLSALVDFHSYLRNLVKYGAGGGEARDVLERAYHELNSILVDNKLDIYAEDLEASFPPSPDHDAEVLKTNGKR